VRHWCLEILDLDESILELDESIRNKKVKTAWARKIAPFASKNADLFHKGTKARDQLLDSMIFQEIKVEISLDTQAIQEKENILTLIKSEQYATAIPLLRTYIKKYTQDTAMLRELAHCYEMNGETSKAIKSFLQLLKHTISYTDLCTVGKLYLNRHGEDEQSKDLTAARSYLKKAIKLDSTETEAYHHLAMSYFSSNPRTSEKWFQKAITHGDLQDLSNFGSYYWLSLLYLKDEKYDKVDAIISRIEQGMPKDNHLRMFIAEKFNSLTEVLLQNRNEMNARLVNKLLEISTTFDPFNPQLAFQKSKIQKDLVLYTNFERLENDSRIGDLVKNLAFVGFFRHTDGYSEEGIQARNSLIEAIDRVDIEHLLNSTKILKQHYPAFYNLDEFVFDFILENKQKEYLLFKDIKSACDAYDLHEIFNVFAKITHDQFLGLLSGHEQEEYITQLLHQFDLFFRQDHREFIRNIQTIQNQYIGFYYAQKNLFDACIDTIKSSGLGYRLQKKQIPQNNDNLVQKKKDNIFKQIQSQFKKKQYQEVVANCQRLFAILQDDHFGQEVLNFSDKAKKRVSEAMDYFWEAKFEYLNQNFSAALEGINKSAKIYPHNKTVKSLKEEITTLVSEQHRIFESIESDFASGNLSDVELELQKATIKYGEHHPKVEAFHGRLKTQHLAAEENVTIIKKLIEQCDFIEAEKALKQLQSLNSDAMIVTPLQEAINSLKSEFNSQHDVILLSIYQFNFLEVKEHIHNLVDRFPKHPKTQVLAREIKTLNRNHIKAIRKLTKLLQQQEWEQALDFFETVLVQTDTPKIFYSWLKLELEIYQQYKRSQIIDALLNHQKFLKTYPMVDCHIKDLITHIKEETIQKLLDKCTDLFDTYQYQKIIDEITLCSSVIDLPSKIQNQKNLAQANIHKANALSTELKQLSSPWKRRHIPILNRKLKEYLEFNATTEFTQNIQQRIDAFVKETFKSLSNDYASRNYSQAHTTAARLKGLIQERHACHDHYHSIIETLDEQAHLMTTKHDELQELYTKNQFFAFHVKYRAYQTEYFLSEQLQQQHQQLMTRTILIGAVISVLGVLVLF